MLKIISEPIGTGRERACYVHPEDPRLAIKMPMGEVSDQTERDLKFYRKLKKRGIDDITTLTPRSQNVAVATSAGVIGAAIAHVLGLEDLAALQLSYVVLNSAVTRVEFDGNRRTLASFNSTAHLERAGRRELLTYL